MLELRYNNLSKAVTGWCGDEKQFGNLERDGHTVVKLDIPIPDKPAPAWLCDGKKLIPNPDYTEPEPPRDLAAELDVLKDKVKELEK